MMATKSYEVGVKYTTETGAWAMLCLDAQGGYRPGLGPTGVYYVRCWSPEFTGEPLLEKENGVTDGTAHWNKAVVNKWMSSFLRRWK